MSFIRFVYFMRLIFAHGYGGLIYTGSALVWLAYPWTRVRAPAADAGLAISWPRFHRAISGAQGVLTMRVGAATSQLNLPSLASMSVAGCGRLQLGVPHLAASVGY